MPILYSSIICHIGDPGRAERTMTALLHRMLKLNENQTYTYDREGLIKLLDEEMTKLQP